MTGIGNLDMLLKMNRVQVKLNDIFYSCPAEGAPDKHWASVEKVTDSKDLIHPNNLHRSDKE